MKLAIAGFGLESVTFLPDTTGIEDFERSACRGAALIETHRDTNSVLGGFISVAQEENVELIGIVYANAGAAAAASEEAYHKYVGEIVDGLVQHRDEIDGCALFLHGALATPSQRRADAGVLRAIRQAMGDDFAIAVGMDLHGNLGAENIEHASIVTGYYFSPHTDMAQTGERAARALIRTLRGEIKPRMALRKPGIILPSIFSATILEPLAELIRDARQLERSEPAIVDISIFCGFAYADVPDCGMSVVVIADDDQDAADRVASLLSAKAWTLRAALFKRELIHSVASGLDHAIALAATATAPVCLLEHADRLNDSTYVLREMLSRGINKAYAPFMFDPLSAQRCVQAGANATLMLELCGKSSTQAGGPLQVRAQVLWAGRKHFAITGPLYTGAVIDLGPCALIRVDHILISLISIQWSAIDLDCFVQFDLDPRNFDFVLLRSKTHFRHVYAPLCEAIVIIDTPDWGPADLRRLPYEFVSNDSYPLLER